MFLTILFYWLKQFSNVLKWVIYALVGVSSLLLVVKIYQSKKLLEVIYVRCTLQSGIKGVREKIVEKTTKS